MSTEIITKEDLQIFRVQLLNDLKSILDDRPKEKAEWLRSSEIREQLKISAGTLQNLRISGKLKSIKIGGINFYKQSDLEKLLNSFEGN